MDSERCSTTSIWFFWLVGKTPKLQATWFSFSDAKLANPHCYQIRKKVHSWSSHVH
jgi:hypothetical protein